MQMVIIGDSETLLNAKSPDARKHWAVVLDVLQRGGNIVHGLPAVCQQHRTVAPPLSTPEAFAKHTPDGGCCMPCNATMPCGHTCTLRCHAYDRAHERVRCTELVHRLCAEGHMVTQECWESREACPTCVEIQRIKEKQRKEAQELVGGHAIPMPVLTASRKEAMAWVQRNTHDKRSN